MIKELKAAVERAYERADEDWDGGMSEESFVALLLTALTDEPEVAAYIQTTCSDAELHKADVRDILKTLAEIVR